MAAFIPDPENADELINDAIAQILADRACETFNDEQRS
jgi:hypothetical protein